jgi:dipeptidyl aminopeptidase/acylaminoacyl peptidase
VEPTRIFIKHENPHSNVLSSNCSIHGEKDYRLTVNEGISMFTALQRQGVPSKLLYFPDENHWVLKPANWIQWQREIHVWLDTWTNNSVLAY